MPAIIPFIPAIIGAAGAIGGAAIASHGAGKAAEIQGKAGEKAAGLQQPFVQAGQGAVTQLSSLTGPGGALMQPWDKTFQAPTNVTEQNDPGFQFRLQQGQQALERSAAAHGGLLSGGTAKELERYAQNFASNEYQNVYNRSLAEYQQAYNIFQQNQQNQYSRLMGVAGLGQNSAMNVGSILTGTGAAKAAGAVGSANAWSSGLQGATSSIANAFVLNDLLNKQNLGMGQLTGGNAPGT